MSWTDSRESSTRTVTRRELLGCIDLAVRYKALWVRSVLLSNTQYSDAAMQTKANLNRVPTKDDIEREKVIDDVVAARDNERGAVNARREAGRLVGLH